MHKLAGLDAGFLYNETEQAPQHIASIQVLELPEGVEATQFITDFKRLLVSRAHLVPYFTNKLQFVPFNLDHPVWVADANFDIDRHVHHVEVAAPGGRREVEAKIAELHAEPLDRSRPLWDIWVLTGLECGRIAYYNRVHHACLDGVSGQAAIQAIMDVTPEPRVVEPVQPAPIEQPGFAELIASAFENLANYQIRQAGRALEQVEAARRLFQRSIDPSKGLGAIAESAPRIRFNRSVRKARTYATGELSLKDVKAIGKATGTTVNDVFLAICAGGLREYLSRSGELPEKSLVAGCPVSLRKPDDQSANNQVTMMMVSFATDDADCVKRLLKIGRSSGQAKGFVADTAGSFDTDVALPGLPVWLSAGAQAMEASGAADMAPSSPCNVVVSNVPGPREQLYSLGARVLTHYPVSIPAHGQGANITVQSYMDQMFFGITACARALPDADVLRNDMLAAFVELKERVLTEPAALIIPRVPQMRPQPLGTGVADPVRRSEAA